MSEIDPTPGWSERRAGHWARVYLANLIVPFLIALVLTHRHEGGCFGALAAAGVVGATGFICCGWFPRLGGVLIRGARVLAFTQFFPILHLGSLTVAVLTWFEAFGFRLSTVSSVREVAFFGVALLAALPLFFLAFVFGGGHGLVIAMDDDPQSEE